MRARVVLVLVLLVLVFVALPRTRASDEPPLSFVERVLGGPAEGDALPLVIALHGLGDSPEHFAPLFEELGLRFRLVAPRAPDPWRVGTSWFPIDDRKRAPAAIQQRAATVVQLAHWLQQHRAVKGKPIVTGFSQGGYLSYAIAAYHSQHFAAALPIAGALPPGLPAYRRARPEFRVIAFHGEDDRRVPYADGRRTSAALRKAGTRATLTGFPGLGHAVSPELVGEYREALRGVLDRLRD